MIFDIRNGLVYLYEFCPPQLKSRRRAFCGQSVSMYSVPFENENIKRAYYQNENMNLNTLFSSLFSYGISSDSART